MKRRVARRSPAPMMPLVRHPGPKGPELERSLLDATRSRVRVLVAGSLAFLGLLGARATVVMAVPDDRLEQLQSTQFQSAIEIRGRRGPLLDRKGRLLAYTVSLPALYANPSNFPAASLDTKVPEIAALVGRPEAQIRLLLTRPKTREVLLGDALDPAAAAAVLTGTSRDQLWLRESPTRFYPGKAAAAPLLGFVDGTGSGTAGLEKVLDRVLTGETYRLLQVQDRKGRSVQAGVDEERLAQEGRGVRLTLDAAIQHEAERALAQAMLESRPESAMAVVLDVKTGGILAMASLPAGNPNDGEARAVQTLFKNRPAMDQVEPGSVMKPFIAAAAIEEGLVTSETVVDCELGAWVVGDRTIHDEHPQGLISVSEVIRHSSNIGAAKLAFQLGAERTLQYLSDFGFARPTGLGLPGEVSGQMRGAASIRPIELATTAFGQGVTASPVQLVAAAAALANGGVRMSPRLVDAVLDRFGAEENVRESRVDRRVVSEETARLVGLMMQSVLDEGGTGTRARIPGYKVAGKTGTAQKVENGAYSPTKRVGSFVGFLPAERPEVAIAVVIDTPSQGSRFGGVVAAPAFAQIGAFCMRYLGVAPDEPVSPALATDTLRPAETPVQLIADGSGSWVLPDLAGRSMRAVLAALGPSGLHVEVEGDGRLVRQDPAPGTHLAPGEAVRLAFD